MLNRILILGVGVLLTIAATTYAQQGPPAGDPPARQGQPGQNFVDANGDGICDNCQGTPAGAKRGKAYGPGDGTGRRVGPKDGTGYGPGSGVRGGTGAGTCDGTQKGRRTGRGRR